MRRTILSLAAAAVIGTSLFAAAPAKADWPYYGGGYYHNDWRANDWRANEWREHQYWAWRHHMWWQEHHSGYWQPGGYWYR